MANGKLGNSGWGHALKQFLRNTSGNMTMTFALGSIPLFLAVGAAIDASRIGREDSSFHAAVDSACLAVAADDRAAAPNGTISAANQAGLETMAQQYIKTNYSPSNGYAGEASVTIKVTGAEITTDASLDFPTTIMKLAGVNSIQLNAHCKVALAMKPVEVAIVMDTTGSMAGTKITQSKAAAHKFLETVYGGALASKPRSEYVRVALVPFAAAVRLDKNATDFSMSWIDTNGLNPLSTAHFKDLGTGTNMWNGNNWNNYSAWSHLKLNNTTAQTWNGCVESRMVGSASAGTNYNINDAAPVQAQPETLFPAYFAPDTYTNSSGMDGDYITNASTPAPPEWNGYASSAAWPPNTAANQGPRQWNLRKYEGRVVGAENTTGFGPWYNCAASAVVPMTYDRASVDAGIDLMTAYGNTLLPEGLSWGYRVLSPTAPFTQVQGSGPIAATTIAPFNGPRWLKIMIFMTDGQNDMGGAISSSGIVGYNGTSYSAYGYGNEPLASNRYGAQVASVSAGMPYLDTATSDICTIIKNQGIQLYVVGFQVPSSVKPLLQGCATKTTAPYYQDATTSNITTLFDGIGKDVLNKMVYIKE